jgi:hypothetical protein
MNLIQKIIEARPSIKKSAIAAYLGVSNGYLSRMLNGAQPIQEKFEQPLKHFAEMHGVIL